MIEDGKETSSDGKRQFIMSYYCSVALKMVIFTYISLFGRQAEDDCPAAPHTPRQLLRP
jgi:hypothetical protein